MKTLKPNRSFTRRILLPPMVLFLAFSLAACRGRHSRASVKNEEPEGGPRMASSFKMNEPAAAAQLLSGFYGVESGSWRWTKGKFSVFLRSPLAAAQRGGRLNFSFSVPDVSIQKLGPITLTAAVGPTALKSETYSKSGAYTLTADVPAELMTKEAVTFDFTLDKSMPPGSVDQRELGVIATAAGLESK